jgi:hypothetical protein
MSLVLGISGGLAIVMLEKPAESLLADDLSIRWLIATLASISRHSIGKWNVPRAW